MGRIRGIKAGFSDFRQTVMWRLIARQRNWIIALLVSATGAFTGAVGTADTLRKLVDEGVVDRTKPVGDFVDLLIALALFTFVFGFAMRQVISRLGYHLEFELRIWLYERLQSTDPARLDALATGQMVTRAMTDLLLLQLLVLVAPAVVVVGLVLVAIGVLMIDIHPGLSILTFTMMPVNLWVVARVRRHLWGMSWVMLDRRARVTTVIDEAVRGARVVKAFGREDHERERLRTAARNAYGAALTRVRLVARYDLFLAALPAIVMGLLTWLGTRAGVAGDVTVGDLLLFFQFAIVFVVLARSFGLIQSAWQFAKTGAGRIFELIAYAKPAELDRGVDLPSDGEGLALRGASVWIQGHPVIAPLTFTAGPGELIVVSGPPRSGKTTLARAIAGGCDLHDGTAELDGIPIADADALQLRQSVRVVNEDPFLFGRTVRENLLLGAPAGTTDA
ncbi:MAG: ABC transporter ATP-binding protein/permease, partial [Actinomycetota bacterium]|nr:ABC transporter ATP-binding protein/permease [Actinomycetota bacterium]